ncbi:MAG: hypothetical protein EHM58_04455 [Ignavibacteriae bacterium]|nr:MAG: hypothetical protein EHM58_04455 [Ignavibacteriota bacterium]
MIVEELLHGDAISDRILAIRVEMAQIAAKLKLNEWKIQWPALRARLAILQAELNQLTGNNDPVPNPPSPGTKNPFTEFKTKVGTKYPGTNTVVVDPGSKTPGGKNVISDPGGDLAITPGFDIMAWIEQNKYLAAGLAFAAVYFFIKK